MRVIINFTENKELVPIVNQSMINSYIHKCIGVNNEYHDTKSNYCISSLYGGKLNDDKKTLSFKNGGHIAVTSNDEIFLDLIISGVMTNPNLFWGMEFINFDFIKEDFIGSDFKKKIDMWHYFSTLSPFIIKKYSDKSKYTFSTLNDEDFEETVKNHVITKLSKIYEGINLKDFNLIIPKNDSHKVKKILVKNVINKANQCQIAIFCKPDVAEKIYNMGIGQSTGSGFGTIYKTENHAIYRTGSKNNKF